MTVLIRYPVAFVLITLAIGTLACDRSSRSGFSRQQFQQADFQLRRAMEAAQRGDVNQAEMEFQAPHSLLHQIDLPLRNRGHEELADSIFAIKNQTEIELAGERRPQEIARLLGEILALLPRAASALGAGYT